MVYEIKIWFKEFEPIINNQKLFEVLPTANQIYKVGDNILFAEWDELNDEYTGREVLCNLTYILFGGGSGINKDYAVVGFVIQATKPLSKDYRQLSNSIGDFIKKS